MIIYLQVARLSTTDKVVVKVCSPKGRHRQAISLPTTSFESEGLDNPLTGKHLGAASGPMASEPICAESEGLAGFQDGMSMSAGGCHVNVILCHAVMVLYYGILRIAELAATATCMQPGTEPPRGSEPNLGAAQGLATSTDALNKAALTVAIQVLPKATPGPHRGTAQAS